MKAIHCQACNRFEEIPPDAESSPTIPRVRVEVHGFDVGRSNLEADICLRCLTRLRREFFGISPDEGELPSFLERTPVDVIGAAS